jgi:8-amino-7-oxononanoate synthase
MHRHKLTPESDSFLTKHLEQRKNQNAIRQLSSETSLIDFCSNDYLGFARSRTLMEKIRTSAAAPGSTGSRLISGNSMLCEDLERTIAEFHQAPAGLIFNSGFDANLGLLSSVARRGDTILYDELVHASIRDGIRLSFAKSFPFSHNNIAHLEARLRRARGELFVAVESVYSMDGDCAPLPDMANVCDQFGAHLIIDEAHATGVFGPGGRGLVVQEDLAARVFARVHTFGKALGSHGAIVLGSAALRSYLINFARSFIYTTALPPHSLRSIRASYQFLHEAPDIIERSGMLCHLTW